MFRFFKFDETDPISRSYRHYFRKFCVFAVVLLILSILAFTLGIPHLQTTYTYFGPEPENGIPTADQKIDAWYISVTGWQHVQSGEYGHDGCPAILFIPIEKCIDLPWE